MFDATEARTLPVARGVASAARLGTRHNFAVLGIARASTPDSLLRLVDEVDGAFPIVRDPDRSIASALGVSGRLGLVGVDREGRRVWRSGGFPGDPDRASLAAEAQLREHLRLPALPIGAVTADGSRAGGSASLPSALPAAPRFSAPRLGGGEPFSLDIGSGRPLVLIFFLHGCPFCQEAIGFHRGALAQVPEERRPRLVGIEVSGASNAVVEAKLAELGLADFEVVRDPDWSIQHDYGVFGDVPVTFYIDADLRIVHRGGPGWDTESDSPLATMYLARILGARVPAMLSRHGFAGNEICGACHGVEYAAWRETAHSRALDTLVDHGRHRDPECVTCHTVGFGQTGGYVIPDSHPQPDRFEGVGCESCHGRGGPHIPGLPTIDPLAQCQSCHDEIHSLGFEVARDAPRVSHIAIAALDERSRRELRESDRPLLPRSSAYVGSQACRSCHAREYGIWSAGGHARAAASLESDGKDDDPGSRAECLRCHTTGFGRTGGFPKGGTVAEHTDLGRVGCESCHGPGGDHVADDLPRAATIVALSEKCDSCVILQICGGCHDDTNDPGFAFRVEEMIERQQHGGLWSPGS